MLPTQKYIKPVIILVAVLLAAFLGLQVYRSLQFHIVRTSPSADSFPTSTPYVRFYFNQPLMISGTSITADQNTFGKYKIDNKSLTLPVIATNLAVGSTYTITLNSVHSTSGKVITNKTYHFTAKDIAFQKLPKDLQAAILTSQANRPATRDNYAYSGTDTFINDGLTSTQVAGIQQAVFQYIQQQKLSVDAISFSGIEITPFDPHQTSGVTTGTFIVKFDNSATLNASLSYSDLTHIDVALHDPTTGKVVYDSGSILPD